MKKRRRGSKNTENKVARLRSYEIRKKVGKKKGESRQFCSPRGEEKGADTDEEKWSTNPKGRN